MRQGVLAANAQCANPNNHAGPCGPPGTAVGIIIVIVLGGIVALYGAFWVWMRTSKQGDPHTPFGRLATRLLAAMAATAARATRRRD